MSRGRLSVLVGVVAALGLTAFALEQRRPDDEPVEVILADHDGLPEVLVPGQSYLATFTMDWTGPRSQREGEVSVFASRRGPTSDDAPPDEWPLVCETEIDEPQLRSRIVCSFDAPGEGEFALQVQVAATDGVVIAEGLFVHLVDDGIDATDGSDDGTPDG